MEKEQRFVKSYIVEFYEDENGGLHSKRQNNGFNAFEILGMLEKTKIQITQIMTGQIEIPIENTRISNIKTNRLSITEAINKEYMNVRLKNALIEYAKIFDVEYLDEVDENKMAKKIRNVGNFTKNELIDLKEKLNIK